MIMEAEVFYKLVDLYDSIWDFDDNFSNVFHLSDKSIFWDWLDSINDIANEGCGFIDDDDYDDHYGSPIDIVLWHMHPAPSIPQPLCFRGIPFTVTTHDANHYTFSSEDGTKWEVSDKYSLYKLLSDLDELVKRKEEEEC